MDGWQPPKQAGVIFWVVEGVYGPQSPILFQRWCIITTLECFEARLGIPIFCSDFWDPHRKWNSDSVFDSKDSSRTIFFEFRCLKIQKIGIPISKFGIPVPHKKTDTYSSVDTKVHGKKPSPYKTAGELFFPPNLHLLTLIGKQTCIYEEIRPLLCNGIRYLVIRPLVPISYILAKRVEYIKDTFGRGRHRKLARWAGRTSRTPCSLVSRLHAWCTHSNHSSLTCNSFTSFNTT